MILKVNSKKLLTAMQTCSRAVNKNNIIPALSNYLFSVTDKSIQLTANNTETQISTLLDCSSDEAYSFAAPQALADLLSKLPDQSVTISVADLKLKVEYAGGECEMPVEKGEDFPVMACKTKNTMVVDGGELSVGVNQTLFAVSNNELQTIRFLHFKIAKDAILIEGLDGGMCSRYTLENKSGVESDLLLTKNSAVYLTDLQGETSIIIDSGTAQFISGNVTITCARGNETYPDIDTVIPKEVPIKSTVDTKQLLSAIKRVGGFGEKLTYSIKLSFNKELVISASDNNYKTKAQETIPCSECDIEIGFNSKQLTDLLSHVTDETVTFEMSTPKKAALIKTSDTFFLIMPVWTI